MPGTAELQSLVTLEAMSASTPVLLANAMALPHLVEQGRNGYLFEPGNSTEVAGRITEILGLPEAERRKMGQHSRDMVDSHSLEGTLATFEKLYRADSASLAARTPGHCRIRCPGLQPIRMFLLACQETAAVHGAVAQPVRAADS